MWKKLLIPATVVVIALVIVATWEREADNLPDFRVYEAGPERKDAFLGYLRPIVEAANADIAKERERLAAIAGKSKASWFDRRWLANAADRYDVEFDAEEPLASVDVLMRRIDTVPASLALAQAAKESGWGTSRFARDGNNLFGEWCFRRGCGLVPKGRGDGQMHEVRTFREPRDSINSYLLNLNTHRAYRELRRTRETLRAEGETPTGQILASGLSRYSERGAVYVDEIRSLIRVNDLE